MNSACDGRGWIFASCWSCDGSGQVKGNTGNQYGLKYTRKVKCPSCGGSGQKAVRPCGGCNNCK